MFVGVKRKSLHKLLKIPACVKYKARIKKSYILCNLYNNNFYVTKNIKIILNKLPHFKSS